MPDQQERYRPMALIGVVVAALLLFSVFFLGFLVAPLAVLAFFYVAFAASDRSRRNSGGHAPLPAPGEQANVGVAQAAVAEAPEDRLAREAAARSSVMDEADTAQAQPQINPNTRLGQRPTASDD